MNLELENKIVVITGGTGGVGRQIVADFLVEGSIVVCLIRNTKKMGILKSWIDDAGINTDNLKSFQCNLLDHTSINSVIAKIAAELKRIDVLVNCAGYADEYPLAMLDQGMIEKMLDLNLKSPIVLSQAVLKTMFKQKQGCIINVSSISAVKKGRGITVYAAAKAGLEAFTRTLAIEVGRKSIRVNGIRPGVIETQMSKPLMARAGDVVRSAISLGRLGDPTDISRTILFMASERTASYMTGEIVTVDGGIN